MLWVLIRSVMEHPNEYPQHNILWRNKKIYPRIIKKYSQSKYSFKYVDKEDI